MNYYRIAPDTVELIERMPPQTIHPFDWTYIRDHITDTAGSSTTTTGEATDYRQIKVEQLKSENRGTDLRYIKFEQTPAEVLLVSILLCSDCKIESLTGDIPSVVILASTPVCKVVHALVSVFAQAGVSDLQSVARFMLLIERQKEPIRV